MSSAALSPPYALLGNTHAAALVDARGTVGFAAFKDVDAAPLFDRRGAGGSFELEPEGPYEVSRRYIGETAVLQTLYTTPNGKASVLDFLPLRPGSPAEPGAARVVYSRVVRIVEGHEGQVRFRVRYAPRPDGANAELQLDANGLVASGPRTSAILHTEAELVLQPHEARGHFELGPQDKRHFVVTQLADPDPDVPAMNVGEPTLELDGSFDYWLGWAAHCPFQGVQRAHVLRLAALLKAAWAPVSGPVAPAWLAGPYGMLAPVALAAWGYERELAVAFANWRPNPACSADRERAAWMLWALAEAQADGMIEATLIVPHWEILRPLADALAVEKAPGLAAWAGLTGALALADELLLPGDAPGWAAARARAGQALAERVLPTDMRVALLGREAAAESALQAAAEPCGEAASPHDALAACWRVRRERQEGAYLQARRAMDALLLSFDGLGRHDGAEHPVADLGELALTLWTAAQIYLLAAPTPGRVELPGDLGA